MSYYETDESILIVENLSVAYDGKPIIENINFDEKDVVRPGLIQGQTIGFVGRSGRGKSTLFRSLAGLEKPSSGKILISNFGEKENESKFLYNEVKEGDVGFVSQNYILFRHKTILQAMEFAMRKQKMSDKEKQEIILKNLKEWGLEEVKNQYPNELSGGQRQRTAILEQVLSSTNYIILDEPFSGLDIGNIQNVKNAFKLINSTHELNTIIFCTHDIELAVSLADSLYVLGYPTLENGYLKTVGTLIKKYDIKKLGLSWQDEFTSAHQDLAEEVKQTILNS